MKIALLICSAVFVTCTCFGQSLCVYDMGRDLKSQPDSACSFSANKEAFGRIDSLMKLVGLPMNFTVCKRDNFKNAEAWMDLDGTRNIVYDDVFLRSLDSDQLLRLQTITVLAHEIGHHLSGHTLGINQGNSTLAIRRERELEADRFAGFIMCRYGATIKDVVGMYTQIASNSNDQASTHPALNKRVDAATAGFDLAQSKAKSKVNSIDLTEIRGRKIEFVVKDISRIERNQLIWKIKHAAITDAISAVSRKTKYNLTNGWNGGDYTAEQIANVVQYHGPSDKYWLDDNGEEYFEALNGTAMLADDFRVKCFVGVGIEIKSGMLRLIWFDTPGKPKVMYASPFLKNKISFEEITTIFTDIFKDALQKELDKYY